MDEAVLVGDVGGTNARFAMAYRRGDWIRIEQFARYAGADFPDFDAALESYLGKTGLRPGSACIAVAGPVRGGKAQLTNRDWSISEEDVSERFGIARVLVVNDFVAMARSVPELEPDAFSVILEGTPVAGAPIVVAGPGTGFGVSTLIPSTVGWTVLAGEGGHIAYAPRTELERNLARLLARDHGYVSNELVASGSGLEEVHAAFCEIHGRPYAEMSPAGMRVRADGGDAMYKALIQMRALAVMGAVGDLALANGALGGVVLAGGVSERIADFLKTPEARERFVSRGPMSGYLADCPVRLLHEATAPLIGAAAYFVQVRAAGA
ncbi:MAG: glucokinase [Hyphomonas sp.]|nr:glucokinase [Hyphomonas sp.]